MSRSHPARRSVFSSRTAVQAVLAIVMSGAALWVSACGGDDGPTDTVVETIISGLDLSSASLSMFVGDSREVVAAVRTNTGATIDPSTLPQGIVWASSDQGVAVISQEGVVTGVGAGKSTISASLGGYTASLVATVLEIPTNIVTMDGSTVEGSAGSNVGDGVRIRLRNAQGNGVEGIRVRFTVLSGGGAASPAEAVTDTSGLAASAWKLGPKVGQQQLEIRALLGSGASGVDAFGPQAANAADLVTVITANVEAAPPAKVVVSPPSQTVTSGQAGAVSAMVLDAFDNPVGEQGVVYTTSDAAVASPNGSGAFTGSKVGTATITATAVVNPALSGTATVTVQPGAPASITKVGGDAQWGEPSTTLPSPLVVQLADAGGNVLSGVSVSWSVVSGPGSVSAATSVTDGSGRASVTLSLGAGSGPVVVSATAAGAGSVSFSATSSETLAVSAVSPTSGPVSGGTAITITGAGFTTGSTVSVRGVPATGVVVNSTSSISAVTPAGTAGSADVVVRAADGRTATLANGFTYVGPPSVQSVSPGTGSPLGGTAVQITGTGFLAGATVTFGNAAATSVVVSSSTLLTAVTPSGTPGPVAVKVTNPDGQSGSLGAGAAGGFAYLTPPTVTDVGPTVGTVIGGTPVTIYGSGFQTGAQVTFNGVAASNVVVVANTIITAVTPAGTAGHAVVAVTNPDGETGSLSGVFQYVDAFSVSSVSPAVGPVGGGTAVSISGVGFEAGATVSFGGVAATGVTVVSSTLITAVTPASAASTVSVVVNNPGLGSATLPAAFTFTVFPTVTGVAPATGFTAGGTAITITGTAFQAGASVTVGGASAGGVTVVSATSITATTPPGAAGAANVVVTNPDGGNGTATNAFTFVPPPSVTSLSPAVGPTAGGTAVTITGSGFQAGATVTIGGAPATGVVFNSSTSLSAVTPAGTLGAATVVVTNPDTQTGTLAGGFTFVPPPTVTSVSPNSGYAAGGTSVTITGTGFITGASVTFGGAAATSVVVTSATSMTATTPAHAAGAVNVVVTNPDAQTGTLVSGYTYVPPPAATSVAPASGYTAGGTAITITGTAFTTGATVTIGGTAATGVTVVSATSITATTPAHAAGASDVVVTNPDGQTGTLAGGFTFVPPPVVTSVSPTSGFAVGGTAITITGSAFTAGATVTVGGTAATGVTVVSPTSITATTPAHAAGVGAIVVTNPDGQTGTLASAFTFVPAPTVTSVSPNIDVTSGGKTVTITGTAFIVGATVAFGGTAATNVTFVSSTSLTATVPAHASGVVNVVVTNPDTQTGTLVGGFTYSPLTITSLSRDAGSTAGGTTVLINGSGFDNLLTPTVAFDGTAAATTFISSSQLSAVTPAHAAGQVDVTVTQGTDVVTLTGVLPNGSKAFEYLPAPTTTYITHDFEDGTLGSFVPDAFPVTASVTAGNWGAGLAVSGTQSVRSQVVSGANGGARLTHLYAPKQPANVATGVYQRWYLRADAATLGALTAGQIKLLLSRSGTNPPSWLHVGIGREFNINTAEVTVFTDFDTGFIPAPLSSRTGVSIPADTWVEIQTHYLRAGGVGRARMWINGKLVIDHTAAGMGTDDTVTKTMSWGFGLEYTQNTVGGVTLTMYTDDAKAADGFIEPGT